MVAMWSSKEKCFVDFFLSCLFQVFMDLNINQGGITVIINSHKESLCQIRVQFGFIDRPPMNILRYFLKARVNF